MRLALPFVLVLVTVPSAQGQTQAATTASPLSAPPSVEAPTSVPPLPDPAPGSRPAEDPARPPAVAAPAESSHAAERTQADEPKTRSRTVWFLVGAVVVLTIVLVATL